MITTDLHQHARALQIRVNHGRLDPMTAAREAQRLFRSDADGVRDRWLVLELDGYADRTDTLPLHAVLGVSAADPLARHVAAYRSQVGWTVEAPIREFRHFFVESLDELVRARAAVASGVVGLQLELEFGAAPAGYPSAGLFDRDVFDRITAGFMAALYLQLRALGR